MSKLNKIIALIKQFGLTFSLRYVLYKAFKNDKKYIKLICNYMDKFLTPLIEEYKGRDITYKFFNSNSKFPVWVCWWQGEENMPELCKVCYARLQKMLPSNAELHLITSQNYFEYVTIPDIIIDQLNEKKITVTYFSDILRESLLAIYGGLWIDSTIFVTKDIAYDYFSDYQFWSVKIPVNAIDKKYLGQQISKGRWSGFILMGTPGNILNTFVRDAMYLYAQKHDIIIDYFIQNLIISVAYDKLSAVKYLIDNVPINNTEIYQMYRVIDKEFNEKTYQELTKNTNFFKLTWKRSYNEIIENGKISFYGYIKNI